MYINLEKENILILESKGVAQFISLWDTLENSVKYYNNKIGFFSSYCESINNIQSAYATPVKVFKIYSNAFDIL